eukprot:6193371-Pleurochrysis_carterae.AAC.3
MALGVRKKLYSVLWFMQTCAPGQPLVPTDGSALHSIPCFLDMPYQWTINVCSVHCKPSRLNDSASTSDSVVETSM